MRDIASACGITKEEGPGGGGADSDNDSPGNGNGNPAMECQVDRVVDGWTESVCTTARGETSCVRTEVTAFRNAITCT